MVTNLNTHEELLDAEEVADVLLRVSSMLMTSGANTNRILLILNRFSNMLHSDAQVFINHKAFIITLTDKKRGVKNTQVRRLPAYVINFSIISNLSEASVKAEQEQWSFEKIKEEVLRIEKLKHHPRWLVLSTVSLAGSGLCYIFNGDPISMLVTFFATLAGLFIRQQMGKHGYNVYLAGLLGALTAAFIAAGSLTFATSIDPQIAIATSVLFLVPGVQLINSFTDFMDGYILTGFVRLMNGLLFVFSIAFALFVVMYLFKIQGL